MGSETAEVPQAETASGAHEMKDRHARRMARMIWRAPGRAAHTLRVKRHPES